MRERTSVAQLCSRAEATSATTRKTHPGLLVNCQAALGVMRVPRCDKEGDYVE